RPPVLGYSAFGSAVRLVDLLDLVLRDGPAEEESLAVLAVVLEEEAALLLGFDAFGERREAERMGERDDRGDELAGMLVFGEVHDEGAVDLQHADPALVEPSEGRVSRAEVVDRELQALLVHVGERF